MKTIFWHDYETFGIDPRRDRPCQFAGIRTDEDLNIIDDPVEIFCQPAPDFLPDPGSCAITGISPQHALTKGVPEAEFCARIAREFMEPGTCVAGYNSIRFDDDVTRHLFYRCFYDPYEREYKNGNSRWDIIDLLRMTQALRPEGINWPQNDDGSPSFRLQLLTAANGIAHVGAHDALADVRATLAMAQLVKQKQPKLYDYLWTGRPIWGITHRNPQLDQMLLDRGAYLSPQSDPEAVALALERIWLDWKNQQLIWLWINESDPLFNRQTLGPKRSYWALKHK